MKYCFNCKKEVNVSRNTFDLGIAEAWQDSCENCGSFIEGGFDHVKDLVFDMSKGVDECEVRVKDE